MSLRPVPVTYTCDPNGVEVAHVPLADGQTATLDKADHDAMRAAGWSDRWCLVSDGGPHLAYVRVAQNNATGNLVTVARIIMEAGRGQVVRYRDRDRTNLRRANLYVAQGAAKRCDAALAVPRQTMEAALAAAFADGWGAF